MTPALSDRTRLLFSVEDNFTGQLRPRRTGLALHPPAFLGQIQRHDLCDDIWFLPRASNSFTTGNKLLYPTGCEHLDAGVSLAVVLGRPIGPGEIELDDARAAIAAGTVALDVVRRDVPPEQAYLARSYMTHTPVSVTLVEWRDLPSSHQMRLVMDVNGERRQEARLSDQIAESAALIRSMARWVYLAPGDVVLTGTPPGLAADHGDGWLEPGDEIHAAISGVGELRLFVEEEA